jgi:hypothetical protein
MLSIPFYLGFLSTATCKQEPTGPTPTKQCRKCGYTLPLDEFPLFSQKGTTGRRNTCRMCGNEMQNIRRKLKRDNPAPPPGPCPVCGKHTTHWVLDHCHFTKQFRGYICNDCNLALGKFDDNPHTVYSAWRYLTRNSNDSFG